MKVLNTLTTYGDDSCVQDIEVISDALFSDRLWIIIDDKKACVIARDLKAAIENATNTNTP